MRVAIVSAVPMAGSSEIGSAYYTRALAEQLSENGLQVEVWAKDIPGEPLPAIVQILKIWRPGLLSWLDILRTCLRRKPAVLHIQHAMFMLGDGAVGELAMLFLLLGLAIVRQRVVITCHDIPELRQVTPEYMTLHRNHFPAGLARFGLRALFGIIGRTASVVIAHQATLAGALVSDYRIDPAKVIVVPLGIVPFALTPKTDARADLGLAAAHNYVLFFGFATGYKGIENLLGAMRILQSSMTNITLIMGAGEHPKVKDVPEYRRYYNLLRAECEALENVRFVGFISDEDLDRFIDAVDVAVFPYVEVQSMSGPLTQCTSHQCPVLVSRPIADTVPGFLTGVYEPEAAAIAEAIRQFFEDEIYRSRVIAECTAFRNNSRSEDYLQLTKSAYGRSLRATA